MKLTRYILSAVLAWTISTPLQTEAMPASLEKFFHKLETLSADFNQQVVDGDNREIRSTPFQLPDRL